MVTATTALINVTPDSEGLSRLQPGHRAEAVPVRRETLRREHPARLHAGWRRLPSPPQSASRAPRSSRAACRRSRPAGPRRPASPSGAPRSLMPSSASATRVCSRAKPIAPVRPSTYVTVSSDKAATEIRAARDLPLDPGVPQFLCGWFFGFLSVLVGHLALSGRRRRRGRGVDDAGGEACHHPRHQRHDGGHREQTDDDAQRRRHDHQVQRRRHPGHQAVPTSTMSITTITGAARRSAQDEDRARQLGDVARRATRRCRRRQSGAPHRTPPAPAAARGAR